MVSVLLRTARRKARSASGASGAAGTGGQKDIDTNVACGTKVSKPVMWPGCSQRLCSERDGFAWIGALTFRLKDRVVKVGGTFWALVLEAFRVA